ncbi:hypothetical protein GCM10009839_56540 [Catenulispora yoronensis]|uniref:Uncharacterized protein n=1 Tax=Catenulispora yoronensis TaxID=450799 RepID=A0ABN2UYA7_9ACTN
MLGGTGSADHAGYGEPDIRALESTASSSVPTAWRSAAATKDSAGFYAVRPNRVATEPNSAVDVPL